MDLIAQGIAGVLAFFAGIVGNIFAHDICASADAVCTKIVRAAAARLAAFDQEATEQEWLSDLSEHETVTEKYRHAVGCYLAAPKMRRWALKDPLVGEAPGIRWRDERAEGKSVACWQASKKAIAEGYMIKSVRLWKGNKGELDAKLKAFIIETTEELQAEHDLWLNDYSYRMQCKAKSDRSKAEFKALLDAGYTRDEALFMKWGTKCLPRSVKQEQPPPKRRWPGRHLLRW